MPRERRGSRPSFGGCCVPCQRHVTPPPSPSRRVAPHRITASTSRRAASRRAESSRRGNNGRTDDDDDGYARRGAFPDPASTRGTVARRSQIPVTTDRGRGSVRFPIQVERERKREIDRECDRTAVLMPGSSDTRGCAFAVSLSLSLCRSNGRQPHCHCRRRGDLAVVAGNERGCVQCISISTRGCHSEPSERRDGAVASARSLACGLRPSRSRSAPLISPSPLSRSRAVCTPISWRHEKRQEASRGSERDGQRTRASCAVRVAVAVLPFNSHLSFPSSAPGCMYLVSCRECRKCSTVQLQEESVPVVSPVSDGWAFR